MKIYLIAAAILVILFSDNSIFADQPTNSDQIKTTIVSIQERVEDLTDPYEPLFDKGFVAVRKEMSRGTALHIVELIRNGNLTGIKSEIGVLLLSGLDERTYWVVTEQLLTTNTNEQVLSDLLSPPFPYGPGYANAYKNEALRKRLHGLETARAWGLVVRVDLDSILT